MTELAPADIAVVLRSIARRVGEAESTAEGEPLPAASVKELDDTVRRIAHEVGTSTSGDRDAIADTAADRIAHVPADQWTDESLDRLRTAASELGTTLRNLQRWADEVAANR